MIVNGTYTGHPTSYDTSRYAWYTQSNIANGYTDSNSTTYAEIGLNRNNNAETYVYFQFDTSSIPSNATITSVSCTVKCLASTTNNNRIKTRTAQLYAGTIAKGSAYTFSDSSTAFSLTTGSWTLSELSQVSLRIYCVRGNNQATSSQYFRFYGATLTIAYKYDDGRVGNSIFIKKNGSWVQASNVLVKVNGTWQSVTSAFKKVNGSWVEQDDKSAMFDTNAVYKKSENI